MQYFFLHFLIQKLGWEASCTLHNCVHKWWPSCVYHRNDLLPSEGRHSPWSQVKEWWVYNWYIIYHTDHGFLISVTLIQYTLLKEKHCHKYLYSHISFRKDCKHEAILKYPGKSVLWWPYSISCSCPHIYTDSKGKYYMNQIVSFPLRVYKLNCGNSK